MAYTYDNFMSDAEKAGLLGNFSKYDLETARKNPEFGRSMLGFKTDYNNAATDEQRLLANEGANQLRKQYGSYTGGGEGLDYLYAGSYGDKVDEKLGEVESYGSFQYSRNDDVQKLLDAVVNQQPFSYDYSTDPSFSAYKKSYLREGERASANALAQASAASGGVPSSYAVTAAQQAGNYYAGQLNDVIPTLEQNAYERYQGDAAMRLNALGALQTDRGMESDEWLTEYNMLLNTLNAYQTQDQTEYGRYQDTRNWAYQQEQAAIQNQMASQQLEDQRKQQAWENALAMYQILGYATPEIAATLGLPTQSGGGNSNSGGGGYYSSPASDTQDETGNQESGDAALTASELEIMEYVEGLLNGGADRQAYASNIIKNSNKWTADQKAFAQDVLAAYRQSGN